MATSAPCYNCGTNVNDFTGGSQLKRIERMVADNYTIIGIAIITFILLFIVIRYFAKQLYEVIKNYQNSKKKQQAEKKGVDDSEIYDEDEPPVDTSKYMESGKTDFVKDLETAYKDYNKLKGEYIRTNYSKVSDDGIDKTAFYKKHDDYSYTTEE
jgi:hypothetical protein